MAYLAIMISPLSSRLLCILYTSSDVGTLDFWQCLDESVFLVALVACLISSHVLVACNWYFLLAGCSVGWSCSLLDDELAGKKPNGFLSSLEKVSYEFMTLRCSKWKRIVLYGHVMKVGPRDRSLMDFTATRIYLVRSQLECPPLLHHSHPLEQNVLNALFDGWFLEVGQPEQILFFCVPVLRRIE